MKRAVFDLVPVLSRGTFLADVFPGPVASADGGPQAAHGAPSVRRAGASADGAGLSRRAHALPGAVRSLAAACSGRGANSPYAIGARAGSARTDDDAVAWNEPITATKSIVNPPSRFFTNL